MLSTSVRDALEPLFAEAGRTSRWFWARQYDLWFSPGELRAEHDRGKFIWGPPNWELRDPQEGMNALDEAAEQAWFAADQFRRRMAEHGRPTCPPPLMGRSHTFPRVGEACLCGKYGASAASAGGRV